MWPTGIIINSIRPGQTVHERVEELLNRKVAPDERMLDISVELMTKAPKEIVLTSRAIEGVASDAPVN